ncbi:MAG: hypothetical protein HDQ91_00795 [Desulfovibrio sp.]|nr:hypothetical protein [Desulfovibrio sp.]
MQGLYGVFPFTVSDSEVCTFRDLKRSRELVYAEHKALDGLSRLQHTGRNLDTVSFNVQIVPLGVTSTVELRLRALETLSLLGTELPLVIGLKYYGMFCLKSCEILRKTIHYGVCLAADVSLNLQEYN